MRTCLFLIILFFALASSAQDLTGAWEGDIVTGVDGQLKHISKIRIELIQEDGKVRGIAIRYPEDTKPTDSPNIVYTVSGNLGKKELTPFLLIKGKAIEGFKEDGVFEFIVNYKQRDSIEYIGGRWYASLEPLATAERARGVFQLQRISHTVSDKLKSAYRIKDR
jgi:hypothetical protein